MLFDHHNQPTGHLISRLCVNEDVLRYYQGWLNNAAVKYGGKQVRLPHMTPLMVDLIRLLSPQIDDLSKE